MSNHLIFSIMAYPTLKILKWNHIITDKENIGLAKKFIQFFPHTIAWKNPSKLFGQLNTNYFHCIIVRDLIEVIPEWSSGFSLLSSIKVWIWQWWKGWCWSWSSFTLATWCEELTHWKRPWCWERLKAGGEGNDKGWHGWMASLTRWTWV